MHVVRPDFLTVEGGGAGMVGRGTEFWLGSYERKVVTVRLRVPAGVSVEANAGVTSTRGGVADAPVRITP